MECSQEISSDVVREILMRTSLEALDVCKLVCSEWGRMTEESTFMPAYCKRNKVAYGFFVQGLHHLKFFSSFMSIDPAEEPAGSSSFGCLPCDMEILASSDHGLLCCVKRTGVCSRYYVGKPTTAQWQALPNPKLRYRTAAVGMVVLGKSPLRYMIARFSLKEYTSKEHGTYLCEVFDSESWAWHAWQDQTLPYIEFISDHPCVFINNSFHWLTYEGNVIALNQISQTFRKFPMPGPEQNDMSKIRKRLVNYQGRLGVTCHEVAEDRIELWVLENRGNTWRREMVMDVKSLGETVNRFSVVGFYNAEIVFLQTFDGAGFYNHRDGSFKRIQLHCPIWNASNLLAFRSDWEPVDLSRKAVA